MPEITLEVFVGICGVVLAAVFRYIPALERWYNSVGGDYKGLLMLAFNFIVAVGIFGLSCAGLVAYVSCTQAGVMELVKVLGIMILGNQTAFLMLPKSAAEKERALFRK